MNAAAPAGNELPPPVRARGLIKRYKQVTAVAGIDLNVGAGEIYGFLGPNGAGKTTTLRMLLGLIRPTAGSIELFGRNPLNGARALTDVAGFVEAPRFYPYLSGRTNLRMLAALDGGDGAGRIDELLDLVDLTRASGQRVGGYSHGMGQRLGIAAALLRRPRLLILDEPATGLDPAGIRDMRLLIERLAESGMTVLLSSHQLPEVQELCDRVAIVRSGRIVFEGRLDEALVEGARTYALHSSDNVAALAQLERRSDISDAAERAGRLHFKASESAAGELSLALAGAGIAIFELAPERASLEDLFFQLTEAPSADGAPPGQSSDDQMQAATAGASSA